MRALILSRIHRKELAYSDMERESLESVAYQQEKEEKEEEEEEEEEWEDNIVVRGEPH